MGSRKMSRKEKGCNIGTSGDLRLWESNFVWGREKCFLLVGAQSVGCELSGC